MKCGSKVWNAHLKISVRRGSGSTSFGIAMMGSASFGIAMVGSASFGIAMMGSTSFGIAMMGE